MNGCDCDTCRGNDDMAPEYIAYWANVLRLPQTTILSMNVGGYQAIEVRHGGLPVKDRWATGGEA